MTKTDDGKRSKDRNKGQRRAHAARKRRLARQVRRGVNEALSRACTSGLFTERELEAMGIFETCKDRAMVRS